MAHKHCRWIKEVNVKNHQSTRHYDFLLILGSGGTLKHDAGSLTMGKPW